MPSNDIDANIIPSDQDNGADLSPSPCNSTTLNYNNTGNGTIVGVNNGTIINSFYIIDSSDPNYQAIKSKYFPGVNPLIPSQSDWDSLDSTKYNIFVLENENFANNAFCMPRRFCLPEEMTNPSFIKRYHDLDPAIRPELYNMPCIFACINLEDYKTANSRQPIVIGRIKEIYPQTENIKFVFDAYKNDIGQQLFNDHALDIGLADVPIRNELDTEHWSVKEGDLKQFILQHNIIIS